MSKNKRAAVCAAIVTTFACAFANYALEIMGLRHMHNTCLTLSYIWLFATVFVLCWILVRIRP